MSETQPMEPAAPAPAPSHPSAADTHEESTTIIQKLGAEAIGTAVLVFIGCGAAFSTQANVPATGLAFGIAIVMMVYTVGRISGGHFNPAVSVGAALAGRLSWIEAGYYALAQIVGALVGGLLLALTVLAGDVGWGFGDPLGSNGFGDDASGFGLGGALLVEILLTFIFVTVILGATDKRNPNPAFAGLAIGLSLAAIHFVAIPLTGTSVNPARSIGVAFFSGADPIKDLWLFIVAPLIGAALAALAYPALFGRDAALVPGSGLGSGAPKPAAPAVMPGQQPWGEQPQGYAAPQPQQSWAQPAPQGEYAAQPDAQGTQVPGAHQSAPEAPGQPDAPGNEPNEQTQVKQSWQQPQQPAQPGELPVYEQDGWRWDYAKQEWVPIQDQ